MRLAPSPWAQPLPAASICGLGRVAQAPASQAVHAGSIPAARSIHQGIWKI